MKPRIIRNLDAVVGEFVTMITDNTEKGRNQLLSIIKEASGEYNAPLESYWSIFYTFSRHRPEALEQVEKDFDKFDDPIIRTQVFENFISKGGWETTSANTRIFIGFINALIKQYGYPPETHNKYLVEEVIPELAKLLIPALQSYRIAEKQKREREAEKEKMFAEKLQSLNHICVTEDKDEAINSAADSAKQSYYIQNKSEVFYYDVMGKSHRLLCPLDVSKAYAQATLNNESLFKVKQALNKARIQSIPKTKISYAEVRVKQITLKESFLLSFTPLELKYFNEKEEERVIDLDEYPSLKAWLSQYKSKADIDETLLFACLQNIVLKKPTVNKTKERQELTRFFREDRGVTLLVVNALGELKPFQKMEGTFFLTSVNNEWQLYERKNKQDIKVEIKGSMIDQMLQTAVTCNDAKALIPDLQKLILSQEYKPMNVNTRCIALATVEGLDVTKLKADSFIVTGEAGAWKVYYVNAFSTMLDVEMTNDITLQMKALNKSLSELTASDLEGLWDILKDHKPIKPKVVDEKFKASLMSIFRKEPVAVPEKQAIVRGTALDPHLVSSVAQKYGAEFESDGMRPSQQ